KSTQQRMTLATTTRSNKRGKYNLDSTYLWHCRLAHISKKRIEKLHHNRLLKSNDEESFDKYVSCLSDEGYVELLERLGYVLSQDISVSLILNGLTSDFAIIVRNYNMHNMRNTVVELHALLIEYEKGLPKKAATQKVMVIQGGRIHKANKKSQIVKGRGKEKGKEKDKSYISKPKNPKPSTKERPTKDDTCHHCKEVGHWKRNCHVYLAELIVKKKQVGTTNSSADKDDTKSQTGYVFILNKGTIDWKSSKLSTTVMFATEAEYIAASKAGMKAAWIRKFISGLGIVPTINEPIKLFCDNSDALHFAYEPRVQKCTRHYHRRYHYVRECIELGKIKLLNVHTDDNLADPFTKALTKGKLTQHARSMGLRLVSSFM
nr:retrovirus-related Pol polyprotein from transposon TNT 1-94 [Tanacetum cinerariifolium]